LDGGYGQSFGNSHWLGTALFVAALLQKKMQDRGNKGPTVLICDDNKQGMDRLADALFEGNPWFDPIYQPRRKIRGKIVWQSLTAEQRFDHIVNCAFAVKSEHSSLIQAADAVCYIFRRHIELRKEKEAWKGEQSYFSGLSDKLERKRETLGQTAGGSCIDFYTAACHPEWRL
jgi:Protein of unknown function (DUF3800)